MQTRLCLQKINKYGWVEKPESSREDAVSQLREPDTTGRSAADNIETAQRHLLLAARAEEIFVCERAAGNT